ncbi:hypothetical protein BpHYR1_019599, partial [Brachionus plicatilis]
MEQLFIGKSFDHFDDFENDQKINLNLKNKKTLQNAYKTPFSGVKNADEERRSLCRRHVTSLTKLDKPVSHKTLFSALDIALNQDENDALTSIYNFWSNKVWIIEFNSAFNSQDIYNRTININGTNFNLEDANKLPDLRRYSTFRFHFLPSNFKCELLKNFFDAFRIDGLRIEDISEENYKDRPLKNGVKK